MSDETASQPQIKLSWLVATLAAFALFSIIGNYSARMTREYSDYDQDRAKVRYETLAKVRHDENALLAPVDDKGKPTAEWVDQDKGVVRIPIEEAMSKELDTLKAQPVAVAGEIPGSVPAPAPAAPATNAPAATAPAATTAAPASPAAPAPGKKKKAKK